jgi:hypothetical protein
MSYTINWSKAFTKSEINTVFCKMSKDDKQLLLNILQDALYIIAEAQHEYPELNTFVTTEFKCLGKGKYYKRSKYIGITAALGGMLKQHKKTKDKDFTVYQIKNIEELLGAFDNINKLLIANKWPETIFAPDLIFKEI